MYISLYIYSNAPFRQSCDTAIDKDADWGMVKLAPIGHGSDVLFFLETADLQG